MSDDLVPEWLDPIVTGSLRTAVVAARSARRSCLSDGADARAADLVAEGDALLLAAEHLLERGEHGGVAASKLRAARRRYERARHRALDVSDGKCPRCRAKLKPFDETIVGPEKCPVIVHMPALRCDACAVTFFEMGYGVVQRKDGVVELLIRRMRWARPDRRESDQDVDEGERLWVERHAGTEDR